MLSTIKIKSAIAFAHVACWTANNRGVPLLFGTCSLLATLCINVTPTNAWVIGIPEWSGSWLCLYFFWRYVATYIILNPNLVSWISAQAVVRQIFQFSSLCGLFKAFLSPALASHLTPFWDVHLPMWWKSVQCWDVTSAFPCTCSANMWWYILLASLLCCLSLQNLSFHIYSNKFNNWRLIRCCQKVNHM